MTYVLVIIGGLLAVLDIYLPLTRTSSVVTDVTQYSSRVGGRGQRKTTAYWSSVELANNKDIWTQRTADNFTHGDSIDVDITGVFGKVVRYRGHRPGYTTWYETESVNAKYRPFPFAAILFATLLLYPRWSSESRMLLRGILLVVVVAWVITTLATGG